MSDLSERVLRKDVSESDFLKSAMRSWPRDKRLMAVFFHEPEMPTGYPDLVLVCLARQRSLFLPPRKRLTVAHAKVLHHLHLMRGEAIDILCECLNLPSRQMDILAEELVNAGLARFRGDDLVPTALKTSFPTKRIIAIEAKLTNWRKALHQAAANTWFASESWILIPPRRTYESIISTAGELGVGILTYDPTGMRTILPPVTRGLPLSYGSWILNEWALRKVIGRDHASRNSGRIPRVG